MKKASSRLIGVTVLAMLALQIIWLGMPGVHASSAERPAVHSAGLPANAAAVTHAAATPAPARAAAAPLPVPAPKPPVAHSAPPAHAAATNVAQAPEPRPIPTPPGARSLGEVR